MPPANLRSKEEEKRDEGPAAASFASGSAAPFASAPEPPRLDEETGWYDFLEDMLVASAEEAQGYRAMHEKAHKHYSKISTRLMIPAIILSTLTGVANFGQTSLEEIVGSRTPLYIGVLSIVAAIFSTVAKYLRADEKSETHRNAMISWDKLHRMIATALVQPRCRREESQEFLMRYREERNRLSEQVPIIPYKIRQWFLKLYGGQYRRLSIQKPGILALRPVTVFRGEHFNDARAVVVPAAAAAAAARPATRLGGLLQRLRSANVAVPPAAQLPIASAASSSAASSSSSSSSSSSVSNISGSVAESPRYPPSTPPPTPQAQGPRSDGKAAVAAASSLRPPLAFPLTTATLAIPASVRPHAAALRKMLHTATTQTEAGAGIASGSPARTSHLSGVLASFASGGEPSPRSGQAGAGETADHQQQRRRRGEEEKRDEELEEDQEHKDEEEDEDEGEVAAEPGAEGPEEEHGGEAGRPRELREGEDHALE